MNCQQFTSFIVEMARGQIMDAASRDGAISHAESCQACAARLAQEQSLTHALRAVALGMKDLAAPPRVEAKLLAAFHDRLAQQNAPATAATTQTSSRRTTRRFAFAVTAIAASLVLVLLAALYLRFTQTAPPSPDIVLHAEPDARQASSPGKELTVAAPAPSTEPAKESVKESARPATPAPTGTYQGIFRNAAPQRATFKLARRQAPTMIKAQHVIDGGNAIIEASEGETASTAAKPNEAESVTDFISLVADTPAGTPLESGQLVRVQLPRAALASLGLPLNAERGNEPVKADVLLGGDGLARAIRFVR